MFDCQQTASATLVHCRVLSHRDPYAMHIGVVICCNMVEWSWWDSSLICKTNWFSSVLWHCWFGHM